MKKDQYLFRDWVPRWLGILIFILLFVPILFVSGIYTSNSTDMASGLGIVPEHIQYSSIASAIGITVFAPFMVKYLLIRRPKLVYMAGFTAMTVFSYVCAVTEYMWLLMLCCFLMGILRIILLFNNLFCMFQYITGNDPMGQFAAGDPSPEVVDKLDKMKTYVRVPFYLFMLGISLWGSSLTARLAYEYKWQYVYYFMNMLLLIATALVFFTMKYKKNPVAANLNMKRFGDMVCASLMLLSFCFMAIYGKTLDWFASDVMRLCLIVFLLSAGVFICLETNTKQSYFHIEIFRRKYVVIAVIVFFLSMIANSSSVFVNMLMGVAMEADNVKSANLGNWGFIGYAIGFVCCLLFTKKDVHIRYVFALGFACMLAANVYMYFHFQSEETYENLIFPVILRSLGLFVFYAMCVTYGIKRMPSRLLTTWAFVLMVSRSVISPTVGASLYSNWLNERQQHYVTRLSTDMDALNPETNASYTASLQGAMAQGKSREEATTMAASSLKNRIQVQATLASLKEVCGWTIFYIIGCIVFVLVLPYPKETIKEYG